MDMTLRVEIFPADLDITIDFYQRILGFQLIDDRRAEDYISLRRGAVQVGAVRSTLPTPVPGGGRQLAWSWCWKWTTSPPSGIGW